MTKVYVLEWANGCVDVFATADEAVECYENEDEETVEEVGNGKWMSLADAPREDRGAMWSDAAKAIR